MSGPCVLEPLWVNFKAVLEMSRRMPVYGYGGDAVKAILPESELVVAWGLTQLPELLAGYRGKVVVVSHGSDPDWTRPVLQASRSVTTHFVAVSEAALRPFEGLVDRGRIAVIPNGLRTDRLQPRLSRKAARRRLGIREGEFVAGYVGRYSVEKQPERLLESVARLGPPYRGLFCGSGGTEAQLLRDGEPAPGPGSLPRPLLRAGGHPCGAGCFLRDERPRGFLLLCL